MVIITCGQESLFFSGQNIVYNNVMLNSVLDLRPGKKKVSTFYHMFFSNISKYFSPVTYRLRRFFIFSVLVVAEWFVTRINEAELYDMTCKYIILLKVCNIYTNNIVTSMYYNSQSLLSNNLGILKKKQNKNIVNKKNYNCEDNPVCNFGWWCCVQSTRWAKLQAKNTVTEIVNILITYLWTCHQGATNRET